MHSHTSKTRTLRKFAKNTCFMLGLLAILTPCSNALTFRINPDSDLVGGLQYTTVRPGQSLSTIGINYDMGIYEMHEANRPLKRFFTQSRCTRFGTFLVYFT